MAKTEHFKEAEKWGMDHGMNAKQTATMMGNIEDESTGISSDHAGVNNYMQYMHGNIDAKNMYDYIGKFEQKMPEMRNFVHDYKNTTLGQDEHFFHKTVEAGGYGQRRVNDTHEFLPQVEKDYQKMKHEGKTNHNDKDKTETKASKTVHEQHADKQSGTKKATTKTDQKTSAKGSVVDKQTVNQPTQPKSIKSKTSKPDSHVELMKNDQTMNSNGKSMTTTLEKFNKDLANILKVADKILNPQNQNQQQNQNDNELSR